jgi:hypothetical protein
MLQGINMILLVTWTSGCLLSLTFFNSPSKLSSLLFRSSSVLKSSLISETAETGWWEQSSGNYENYNRGSYRGRFNTYQGHEVRGRSRYRGFGRGQVSSSINKDQNHIWNCRNWLMSCCVFRFWGTRNLKLMFNSSYLFP